MEAYIGKSITVHGMVMFQHVSYTVDRVDLKLSDAPFIRLYCMTLPNPSGKAHLKDIVGITVSVTGGIIGTMSYVPPQPEFPHEGYHMELGPDCKAKLHE